MMQNLKGQEKKHKAITDLISFLKDKKQNIRKDAAEKLKKIGEPAVEYLIDAMKSEDSKSLKGIREALVLMGSVATPYLIKELGDKDWVVRKNAAIILRDIGDPRAVDPLIEALKKKDLHEAVDKEIIEALDRIRDSKATSPLIELLKEGYIETSVTEALKQIGASAVNPLITLIMFKASS